MVKFIANERSVHVNLCSYTKIKVVTTKLAAKCDLFPTKSKK